MTEQMRPVDVAEQVLAKVRAQAGASVEAEVDVTRSAVALTRFANSFIHQHVADDTTTVRLRLHAGGRTAATATTILTADGLDGLVERTVTAVRLAPADPTWPGLTPPAEPAGAGECDEATAAADPGERAARVRAFVDEAGLECAGYCQTALHAGAFANTAGQVVQMRITGAAMDGVARTGGSDGVARAASVRLADLDGAALGGLASAKARAAVNPTELPPGRYEVVLEPNAVGDLLQNFALFGFNGKAYAERRSFVELGAAQFDPLVTLVDDPLAADRPGEPYDAEGTPRRRLVLVDAGVTAAVAHDRRTAADCRTVSTGHALGGQGRGFGAIAMHMGLQAGADAGPAGSTADWVDPAAASLIAGVQRGLLVTDLYYTRVLDPRTLVMTGLTRNGVWQIEDGKVTVPVSNFRFTQSYPQALGPGQVRGVGPVAVTLPGGFGAGSRSAPALHLASWNFTGGASG